MSKGKVEVQTLGVEGAAVEVRSAGVADFADVSTFEGAIRLAQELYGEVLPSYEMGDGFAEGDKDDLVGVPFVIVGWGLSWSAYGPDDRYSIVRVVTQDGRKYRFSDGSTGINKQLTDKFGSPDNFLAIVCFGGLTKSEYQPRNPDGTYLLAGGGKAVTYYLDTETMSIASVNA